MKIYVGIIPQTPNPVPVGRIGFRSFQNLRMLKLSGAERNLKSSPTTTAL
jgi:hypothetical protein